jgi:hypothetical protein
MMFEVHHGGQFNKEHRCTYVGGDVAHYPDPYDRDNVSFIEVGGIVKSYGYGHGDVIYYNIPNKSLDERLRLLSSDHDVLEIVEHHNGHGLVELYLVAVGGVDVDVDVCGEEDSIDKEEEEEYERQTVYRTDAFLDQVLSDDSNSFELDGEDHTEYGDAKLGLDEDVQFEQEVGVNQELGVEQKIGVDQEVGVEPEVGLGEEVGLSAQDGVDEDGEDEVAEDDDEEGEDEADSEMARSDILISHHAIDEEGEGEVDSSKRLCVAKRLPFSKSDLGNPILQPRNTF